MHANHPQVLIRKEAKDKLKIMTIQLEYRSMLDLFDKLSVCKLEDVKKLIEKK